LSGRDPRGERAARNESAFREVNEQLQGVTAVEPGRLTTFVCECANMGCVEFIAVPEDVYERVRQSPDRFLIAPNPDHMRADIELVIETHASYWVVEKRGEAAELAAELDPRS
jgi:hypothetical protein